MPIQPFTTLTAIAVPLPMANVDTDQLIPARFMRKPRSEGYGAYLLHDLRPGLPLDDPSYAGASILVARRNFGTGSSREAAVYALADHGIRCVIAPSFGDIFTANAVKNGLLPARVDEEAVEALIAALEAAPGRTLTVDLPGEAVTLDNQRVPLSILPNHKDQLVNGWDDIDLTLSNRAAIEAFVAADRERRPWALPRGA